MVRTQIYLTETQKRQLEQLAARSGRKQSEMMRDAIDGYLAKEQPQDWRAAFEAVRGMWADRDDLDDLHADLRAGVERRLDRISRLPKRK